MASIIPGFEYDIFISYRNNDNLDGWVSDFVQNLEKELRSTIKEPISIYFDTNPHDGLLETHNVDKSLESKLKCLIFIPIISQTYCDLKSFAWQNEFCPFNKSAREDQFGLDIKLSNGNVASRILPVKIHDLDKEDTTLLESELGGVIRAIEFIFNSPGVNRPLTPSDNPDKNQNQTFYRDQINKVANAIHEIIRGIKASENSTKGISNESIIPQARKVPFSKKLTGRNVLRASLVYILTALVFWKVLVISSGLLHFGENIVQLITLVLIVLFPVAMLMAWFFERSPRGFIRTGSAASLVNPFTDNKKKPFTGITFITLLLVTIAALFLLFPHTNTAYSSATYKDVEKSIAVLPFDNLSSDQEQEYFSDGMMQEILNHLFMIGGLKIPSGTSSMRFKGSKLSVSEIAKELNVSYVLEGNVSRSGDNVRIIVRLINGKNEQLIWTEDYNRSMTAIDLHEIQSNVAQQVAENMKVAINPEVKKRIEVIPTENTEAYTLYLQATDMYLPFDQVKLKLERAILLDSSFADAYALLAERWIYRGAYMGDLKRDQVLEMSEPLLKKALHLDKKSALAHASLAELRLFYYWDFESVEKEFHILNELTPSNPSALFIFSDYLAALGKFGEAYSVTKKCFDQDQSSVDSWVYLAEEYYFDGEQDKALETNETARRLFPNDRYLIEYTIRLFIFMGKYEEASSQFEKGLPNFNLKDLKSRLLGNMGIAYFKTSKKNKSAEFLNELLARSKKSPVGSPSFYAAEVYAAMGEKDNAIQMLEQAYSDHEVEMFWMKVEPVFRHLHGDPRFENLLVKIGLK